MSAVVQCFIWLWSDKNVGQTLICWYLDDWFDSSQLLELWWLQHLNVWMPRPSKVRESCVNPFKTNKIHPQRRKSLWAKCQRSHRVALMHRKNWQQETDLLITQRSERFLSAAVLFHLKFGFIEFNTKILALVIWSWCLQHLRRMM